MANTLGIDFTADAREFATDMPSTLVYKGVTITGIRGTYTRTRDVDPTGILAPLDMPWLGVLADFTGGVPVEGNVVAIDGVNYHVEQTQLNEDSNVIRLEVRRN